jgi:hypothetical protein
VLLAWFFYVDVACGGKEMAGTLILEYLYQQSKNKLWLFYLMGEFEEVSYQCSASP